MKAMTNHPVMVGVAHPGTQHSWQTALAFQEVGRLAWYATSSYYQPSRWPDRIVGHLPRKLSAWAERELRRRRFEPLDDALVRRFTSTEALERFMRLTMSKDVAAWLTERRHVVFPKHVIGLQRREPAQMLWGPHDSLEAFEAAKPAGTVCVLDQPIGHFESLVQTMREERDRNPDFFSAPVAGMPDGKLDRQRRASEVADLIVVGSEFAANTMIENGTEPSKLRVVPYGFDEGAFAEAMPQRQPLDGRPINFLFVGSVGPRKGIAYLLEAFKDIDPRKAVLTIAGPLEMPESTFDQYIDKVNYVGQLRRPEVAAQMRAADCLILPSLFEGGGIVLYEAAAAGLGIIQTDRCGDGVREGKNGVILSEISTHSIRQVILQLIDDPAKLQLWMDNSWAMRHERGWSVYRKTISSFP